MSRSLGLPAHATVRLALVVACAQILAVTALGCGADETDGSGGSTSSTSSAGGGDGDGGGATVGTTSASSTVTSTSSGVAPCTDAAACDDQNPCTDDTCGADGRCVSTPADVDDGDQCTIDACDPLEGETHVTYQASDGDACSLDVCDPDEGTSFVGDLVLLEESFATVDGGWTADPPWAIGPAEPSATNSRGMADPESDTSPGDDDGIAGVVLGGSPPSFLEGSFYLESPEIDADHVGSVALEYRRWLGEEPANAPTVEVWDGEAWVVVWETPRDVADAPPRGEGWVRVQHDVTALKGPTFRVRFGVALGPGGANPSWNLDDVLVIRRGWAVDGDACTTDSCSASSGPRHLVNGVDDGDDCTTDVCHPVAGVAHIPALCDDGADGCCSPGCSDDADCFL